VGFRRADLVVRVGALILSWLWLGWTIGLAAGTE